MQLLVLTALSVILGSTLEHKIIMSKVQTAIKTNVENNRSDESQYQILHKVKERAVSSSTIKACILIFHVIIFPHIYRLLS